MLLGIPWKLGLIPPFWRDSRISQLERFESRQFVGISVGIAGNGPKVGSNPDRIKEWLWQPP